MYDTSLPINHPPRPGEACEQRPEEYEAHGFDTATWWRLCVHPG